MIKLKSGVKTNATGKFWWYNLGLFDDIINREFPEYTLPKTCNRLDVKIIRVKSDEYQNMDGKCELVVVVDDVYLPLGQEGYYPFMKELNSKRYAITMEKQHVFLGVGA